MPKTPKRKKYFIAKVVDSQGVHYDVHQNMTYLLWDDEDSHYNDMYRVFTFAYALNGGEYMGACGRYFKYRFEIIHEL